LGDGKDPIASEEGNREGSVEVGVVEQYRRRGAGGASGVTLDGTVTLSARGVEGFAEFVRWDVDGDVAYPSVGVLRCC